MGLFSRNSNAPKPVESQIPSSVIATPPEALRPPEGALPAADSAAAVHVKMSERQVSL